MELPLISIIIPTYNRSEMLADAPEACCGWRPAASCGIEIVVVDNGSTDATKEVVQRAAARSRSAGEVRVSRGPRRCRPPEIAEWRRRQGMDGILRRRSTGGPRLAAEIAPGRRGNAGPGGGRGSAAGPAAGGAFPAGNVRPLRSVSRERALHGHPSLSWQGNPRLWKRPGGEAGIRDHRQFRRRDGLGWLGQQLFSAGESGRHCLLLHATCNNPPPHSAASADHGVFPLGRGQRSTRWPATTSSSKAG